MTTQANVESAVDFTPASILESVAYELSSRDFWVIQLYRNEPGTPRDARNVLDKAVQAMWNERYLAARVYVRIAANIMRRIDQAEAVA